MNATSICRLSTFALATLTLLPVVATAAEPLGLQANIFMEFVADRSRMIQVSAVAVLLGCAMLWWKK